MTTSYALYSDSTDSLMQLTRVMLTCKRGETAHFGPVAQGRAPQLPAQFTILSSTLHGPGYYKVTVNNFPQFSQIDNPNSRVDY